jgi:hypothetical protein
MLSTLVFGVLLHQPTPTYTTSKGNMLQATQSACVMQCKLPRLQTINNPVSTSEGACQLKTKLHIALQNNPILLQRTYIDQLAGLFLHAKHARRGMQVFILAPDVRTCVVQTCTPRHTRVALPGLPQSSQPVQQGSPATKYQCIMHTSYKAHTAIKSKGQYMDTRPNSAYSTATTTLDEVLAVNRGFKHA